MNSPFKELRREVEAELERVFDLRSDIAPQLLEAMRYSVFAGGKRLRPILTLAACDAVGGSRATALPVAAAIELIHTYTLIHDDLPAMDDDDLRRGMPTNHKKFGEATAILAGDGLLTLAWEVMTSAAPDGSRAPDGVLVEVVNRIAKAVGAQGTVGGQQVDMESEGRQADLETLEYIHTRKTGAMIQVSAIAGGLIGGATPEEVDLLDKYADRIGHAFQVVDDILDVTSSTEELGKPVGSDAGKNKMTYPALMGLDESRKLADTMIAEALETLGGFKGDSGELKEIAEFIGARTH